MKLKSVSENAKNSKLRKKVKEFGNSSFLAKLFCGGIIWIGALIPTWLYLIVRWIASPTDFWQEFAIFMICAIVIGWLQVILAIFAFGLTIALLIDDSM